MGVRVSAPPAFLTTCLFGECRTSNSGFSKFSKKYPCRFFRLVNFLELLQPDYRRLGFAPGDFPEAEAYARSAISLPLYPGLREEEQERVVAALAALL